MSAAIKLIEQPETIIATAEASGMGGTSEIGEMMVDSTRHNVTRFESASEQRARRINNQAGHLQAEINSLRAELVNAERTIARYEQLLRNAMIRERELRAEMVRHMF